MLKKLLSAFLAFMILTVASGANVYARNSGGGGGEEKTSATNQEKQIEKKDLAAALKAKSVSANSKFAEKSTLAEYEKTKAQGKKFSTTTKILIGVGIAAVVITIVAVAVSKGVEDASPF